MSSTLVQPFDAPPETDGPVETFTATVTAPRSLSWMVAVA